MTTELPEGTIRLLDKGFVRLVDSMGGDAAICQAARVSYGKGTKKRSEDRGLIRYLLQHEHGTPFEMTALKFHVKAPIFVFRQWHRHRIGISINEYSGRYSEMPCDFYRPANERIQGQSSVNKQGSDDKAIKQAIYVSSEMGLEQQEAKDQYLDYLSKDVSRELARINLPVSTYSEMYWQCNLRSLFAFCKLRCDSHAQYEIRVYADAMLELAKEIAPIACEAFEDYVLNVTTFSKQEMEMLRSMLHDFAGCHGGTLGIPVSVYEKETSISKRELKEFKEKLGI